MISSVHILQLYTSSKDDSFLMVLYVFSYAILHLGRLYIVYLWRLLYDCIAS